MTQAVVIMSIHCTRILSIRDSKYQDMQSMARTLGSVSMQWQDQLLQLLPQQMQLRGVKLAAALSLLPSPEPGQALSGQAAPNADPADNPQQGAKLPVGLTLLSCSKAVLLCACQS